MVNPYPTEFTCISFYGSRAISIGVKNTRGKSDYTRRMMPGTGIFFSSSALFFASVLFSIAQGVLSIILCFSFFFSTFLFSFFDWPVSLGKIYKSSTRARERQDHSSADRLVGGNGFEVAIAGVDTRLNPCQVNAAASSHMQ